ncbi:uncharacterized protein LOC118471570 [Amphiprion ocellaris]|uniref:uncharacterized protein LOC118471570 n=1 Tax=Amphiprion ocellaris TaxID=80972 RepID=UPI00241115C4|nr:uncharacterized protein LOC118471570 [Amphiprion ocellaris]
MTSKPQGRSPAFKIKRPKRSEVNYCPQFPVGETEATLEKLRVELLTDIKLRNGKEMVKAKMEKTFSYRRYEVIRDAPMVQDFKGRWPALFDVFEINSEFKRLTTLPLQSRFLSKLDLLSRKLQALYEKRGGQIGKKLKQLMEEMKTESGEDDLDSVREGVLRALCVYLNEDPENLIKDHVVSTTIFYPSHTHGNGHTQGCRLRLKWSNFQWF